DRGLAKQTGHISDSQASAESKLDKLLEGGNITLNCLIPGEEARDIFE
ncbi:6022_t:CDS:2, partial [Funneliformis geosporum]